MAKVKTGSDVSKTSSLIEAQVYLNSRGRSVVNGTVLSGSEHRTFKHELSAHERELLSELILREILFQHQ